MILWDRIKRSLDNGIEQVMKVSKVVSERARVEAAVARLLIEKGGLESKADRSFKQLGERVFFLWEQKTGGVMNDQEVMEAVRELSDIKSEIEGLNLKIRKASIGEEEE